MRLDLLRVRPPPPSRAPTVDLSLKLACPLCKGTGMALGVLEAPLVTWCGCTDGLRLRCAIPEDAWPVSFGVAARVADRIGLRNEYADSARVRMKLKTLAAAIGIVLAVVGCQSGPVCMSLSHGDAIRGASFEIYCPHGATRVEQTAVGVFIECRCPAPDEGKL